MRISNGEVIPIFEHATAVADDPGRFGIDAGAIRGLDPLDPKGREAILRVVLERGFCRVRAHKGDAVFEFDYPDRQEVLAVIVKVLEFV